MTKAFLVKKQMLFYKNESQGLRTLSEEPLEHNNKKLEKLARKTTQQANVTDVLTRSNSAKLDLL